MTVVCGRLVLLVYFWGAKPPDVMLRTNTISVASGGRLSCVACFWAQLCSAFFGEQ